MVLESMTQMIAIVSSRAVATLTPEFESELDLSKNLVPDLAKLSSLAVVHCKRDFIRKRLNSLKLP
jgi:hypothetical protein